MEAIVKNLLYKIAFEKSLVAWLQKNDHDISEHVAVINMCNDHIEKMKCELKRK